MISRRYVAVSLRCIDMINRRCSCKLKVHRCDKQEICSCKLKMHRYDKQEM